MAKGTSRVPQTDDLASDDLAIVFGENFKRARVAAGLTQREIEVLTGIRQHYVSQIESGKQNPTLDTLSALAQAVGSDVRTLLKPARTRRAGSA